MNSESRITNTKRNVISAFANKILLLIISFISRNFFIDYIGVEYLGINGLFANVLTLLSVAELGLGTAMNVRLYKPIAENDTDQLCRILRHFRKLYLSIAGVVCLIGLGLIPFLPYLVNLENGIPHLYLYYVIFLFNNVASYLFAYKASIIRADQKNYLVNNIELFTTFLVAVLKIIVILCFKMYIFYLLLDFCGTLIHNIVISVIADRQYPFIKKKLSLKKEEKKEINREVSSAFVYKISRTIISSTDNILISVLVGTITVGLYSNYSTITLSLESFVILLFTSITASVGNLVAKETRNKSYSIFKVVQFVSFWVCTFCSVCLLFLSQDFISLWIGKDMLLDNLTLLSIVSCFYLNINSRPLIAFREGVGMYNRVMWINLLSAILNIGLSIILCKLWGLCGIFFATTFSKLLTTFWFEPMILYKYSFEQPIRSYFIAQIKYFLLFILCAVCSYFPLQLIPSGGILFWLLKAFVCFVIINGVFVLVNWKTTEFSYLRQTAKTILKRK